MVDRKELTAHCSQQKGQEADTRGHSKLRCGQDKIATLFERRLAMTIRDGEIGDRALL